MKDEEMAEEYLKQNNYTSGYIGYFPSGYCKQAFLAGLKAGRPQWHDINDTEPSKEQLGKQLLIRIESVCGNTDYDYLVYKYNGESITDVPGVLEWKEIEK